MLGAWHSEDFVLQTSAMFLGQDYKVSESNFLVVLDPRSVKPIMIVATMVAFLYGPGLKGSVVIKAHDPGAVVKLEANHYASCQILSETAKTLTGHQLAVR